MEELQKLKQKINRIELAIGYEGLFCLEAIDPQEAELFQEHHKVFSRLQLARLIDSLLFFVFGENL